MPDISIQFLALPEELAEFFRECASEYRLHVVKVTFPPYHAAEVPREALFEIFSDLTDVSDLFFTTEAPLPVGGTKQIPDTNPDALRLSIGKRTKSGLEESSPFNMSPLAPSC